MAARACSGTYTLPSRKRSSNSRGGRSISTSSKASCSTQSGKVSRTCTPVMSRTLSLRLSRCCTLTVVYTSMPAASSSCTSCQRLAWRLPGALVCASSSTSAKAGAHASRPSRSISSRVTPRYWLRSMGCCNKPASSASVSPRPWVSTTPATTCTPWRCWACAACSMAKVLPTPGAAPRNTFSRPRPVRGRVANNASARAESLMFHPLLLLASFSRARFNASTLTTGGPINGLRVASSCKACKRATGNCRAAATRGIW